MGLSGPKRRTKLSSDPNNNTWSKSTDGFGHKIMSAQGWKPGQLLGATNAAHSEHYTAANASHIRVMLREDNLGLGAQLGKSNAGSFGLSTLSSIFGRLNGKTDTELEKAEAGLRDAELRAYQTHKFGHMTFIRGGLLVGDKMEEFDVKQMKSEPASTKIKEEPTFKREREDEDDSKTNVKRIKRSSKHADEKNTTDIKIKSEDSSTNSIIESVDNEAKRARKATKQARKDERELRKAARKEERRALKTSKDKIGTKDDIVEAAPSAKTTTIPAQSFAGSRQAVRQRFIQQKRMASMDARALNEILMLKTAVT